MSKDEINYAVALFLMNGNTITVCPCRRRRSKQVVPVKSRPQRRYRGMI